MTDNLILSPIPLDELTAQIRDIVEETIKKITPETESPNQSEQGDEYLTRKEAAKKLKISLVSLRDWEIKGILIPIRINSRVRYRKSDVEYWLTNKGEA